MMSKKNMLIIAGLAVGGLGVASMMSDADDGGDIPQQIKERAGRILGSGATTTTTTTGGERGAIPTQPSVIFGAFPTDKDVFGQDPIIETPDRPVAQRGGGGMTPSQRTAYDIMTATAMGGGVYKPPTKKEVISYPEAVSESYAAHGTGLGGLTAFRETKAALPSKVRGEPTPRISIKEGARAPVEAAIGYVSGGATGLWGAMSRSYATKGKGMSSSVKAVSTKKTPSQPKKSTYVRRREKGYTYTKTGSLTPK